MTRESLAWGPARPLPSTWALLPSEADKRPGLVRVTTDTGSLIATIDPVTRQRRDLRGHLEATLTPQGWARPMHDTAGATYRAAPRVLRADYETGLDRRDVDPRSGRRDR
jgi:hypothetical protein